MNIKRFIIATLCATFAAFCLTVLVFSFPDYREPTPFENICTDIWIVFSWPLIAIGSLLVLEYPPFIHQDPPIFYILSWIATGLFWAFIMEMFFKFKKRRKRTISN